LGLKCGKKHRKTPANAAKLLKIRLKTVKIIKNWLKTRRLNKLLDALGVPDWQKTYIKDHLMHQDSKISYGKWENRNR